MCSASGFRNCSSLVQPGSGSIIVFCSKKHCPECKLSARVLRPELKIFFKVRNCVARVAAEGGSGTHRIIVRSILRLKGDGFLKRVPCFRDELQCQTHQAERIMDVRVSGVQITRVRQISEGAAIVLLLVSHSSQFEQGSDR